MKKSFHCKGWKLTWLPDLSLAAVPLKVVFYHVAHDCFKSSWLILFWPLSLDQLTCAESTPTLWENSDPSSSGSERRSSKEPNLVLEVRKEVKTLYLRAWALKNILGWFLTRCAAFSIFHVHTFESDNCQQEDGVSLTLTLMFTLSVSLQPMGKQQMCIWTWSEQNLQRTIKIQQEPWNVYAIECI